MAIVNNSYKLGNGDSNIVLETAGKIYVKVADRYYELNFRDSERATNIESSNTTIIENVENNITESVDTSDFVDKSYLDSILSGYFTKRDWAAVQETLNMLQDSKLEGFTEGINPITVETMQVVVGNKQLQFEFIESFTKNNIIFNIPAITPDNEVRCLPGYVKHYTLDGPTAVQPEEEGSNLKEYCRWKITDPNSTEDLSPTTIVLEDDEKGYYLYIVVDKIAWTQANVDAEDNEANKTGIYAKTGTGYYLVSGESIAMDNPDDPDHYYLLFAIINSKQNGGRSIATMNGFTEILPGQITAYIFKTKEGDQFLDFLGKRFRIGDQNSYWDWNVTERDTLTIKGNISVIGGDLRDELDSMTELISGIADSDYLRKAIRGRTDLMGGLILTNLLKLGYSTGDPENFDDYYSKFTVMSGINGQCIKEEDGVKTYRDIAAWFGGPMKDLEGDSLENTLTVEDGRIFTYVESVQSTDDPPITMHKWVCNGVYGYTVRVPPAGEYLRTVPMFFGDMLATIKSYNYSSAAKSLFRMDGTGYLANGNISWDKEGNIIANYLTINEAATIGPLLVTKDSVKVIADSGEQIFSVDKNACNIYGSLTLKSRDYLDNAAITITDPSGIRITEISPQPIVSTSLPTMIRRRSDDTVVNQKGSAGWGKLTIPSNWYWAVFDVYPCTNQGGTYKITNLNIKYSFAKISKAITLKIIFRKRLMFSSSYTDTELYTQTFSSGSPSGTISLNASNYANLTQQIDPSYEYNVYVHLVAGGQVQSGIGSDSHIRLTLLSTSTVEVSFTGSATELLGNYIKSNGISSVYGLHSKFQWLTPMIMDSSGVVDDYRSFGGTFLVEVPNNANRTSAIGIRIDGYRNSAGEIVTPGISINLGTGWQLLKIVDGYVKVDV